MAVSEVASSSGNGRSRKNRTKRCKRSSLLPPSSPGLNSGYFYVSNRALTQFTWAQAATNLIPFNATWLNKGYATNGILCALGDGLLVSAARDVNITAGQNTVQVDEAHQQTSKGVLSKKTITTREQLSTTEAVGSNINGQNVTALGQRDINIVASQVIADQDLRLEAGNNLTITAGQNPSSASARLAANSIEHF